MIGFDHSGENDALNFKIVVSTKRMLQHCIGIDKLCVDATYKLNWNGFPFMVVGTEDFRFIFDTLIDNVLKLTNTVFSPRILISDACLAIRNAFSNAFPEHDLMVMCYVHVLRNVDKNKDKYKKENKNEIMRDISTLQLAASRESFDMLANLFMLKWNDRDKSFADYFKKQWLDSHCNWFEGSAEYTPSTNNSLEGNKSVFISIFIQINLF